MAHETDANVPLRQPAGFKPAQAHGPQEHPVSTQGQLHFCVAARVTRSRFSWAGRGPLPGAGQRRRGRGEPLPGGDRPLRPYPAAGGSGPRPPGLR
jgi:hypothetical protein